MNPCPRWVYRAPPAAWAKVGKWVAYSAAEVARRRAARMVLVVACAAGAGAGGYQAARHAPPGWLGLPEPLPPIHAPMPLWRGLPDDPTWRAETQPQPVPEPASGALLVAGVLGLWWRGRR
jgi:hypothetical protein